MHDCVLDMHDCMHDGRDGVHEQLGKKLSRSRYCCMCEAACQLRNSLAVMIHVDGMAQVRLSCNQCSIFSMAGNCLSVMQIFHATYLDMQPFLKCHVQLLNTLNPITTCLHRKSGSNTKVFEISSKTYLNP